MKTTPQRKLNHTVRLCVTLLAFFAGCFVAGLAATHAAQPTVQPLLQGKWTGSSPNAYDVAVEGKYAYLADRAEGLHVIDVSNPASPVRVGGYDTSGDALGVAVAGNYAYVADGEEGLQVIDVSNPLNCVRVGGFDPPGFGGMMGFARAVAVSGNYAYVADTGAVGAPVLVGGLHVIDVSDPTNCVLVGSCATVAAPFAVAVSGNYAYVVGFSGLEVIYIGNPTNCRRVGGYGAGLSGVALSGHYAYVTVQGGMQMIDVTDPTNCVSVGGYVGNGEDANGVAVWGKYAYFTDDKVGLQVIDVSDPTHCVLVGGINTIAEALGVTAVAGRIYVANYHSGLLVLPTIPNVQFSVRVEATPNVPFTIEATTNLNAPIPWTPLLTTNVTVMPFDFVDFDVKLS